MNKSQKGKALRVVSSLVEEALEEVSSLFEARGGISQSDLDVIRVILWDHLNSALKEGQDDSHGLKLKINFLERLLKKKEDVDE